MSTIYLSGWLVTTIIAVIAASKFAAGRQLRPISRGGLAVLAGAVWPVVLIAAIQIAVIALLAGSISAVSANEPALRATDEPERADELVPS